MPSYFLSSYDVLNYIAFVIYNIVFRYIALATR